MSLPNTGNVEDQATQIALDDIRRRGLTPDTALGTLTTPATVPSETTFLVPSGRQYFFSGTMDVQGTLDLQGELVSVELRPDFVPTYVQDTSGATVTSNTLFATTLTNAGRYVLDARLALNVTVAGATLYIIQWQINGANVGPLAFLPDTVGRPRTSVEYLTPVLAPGSTAQLLVTRFTAAGTATLEAESSATLTQVQ